MPTHSQWREILELAATAPSLFNMQPWRADIDATSARLSLDGGRLAPFPATGATAALTLGSFAETALRAARALGFTASVTIDAGGATLVVTGVAEVRDADLCATLRRRWTSRAQRAPQGPLSCADALAHAAHSAGAALAILDAPVQREAAAVILGEGNALVQEPAVMSAGVARWLRVTQREAHETRDGMDLDLLEVPPAARPLMERLPAEPDALIRAVPFAMRAQALVAPALNAQALACLHVDASLPVWEAGIAVGRALVSVWLEATRAEVGVQPIAPMLVVHAEDGAWKEQVLGAQARRVAALAEDARVAFGILPGRRPAFVLRLHDVVAREGALRRPVESFTRFVDD